MTTHHSFSNGRPVTFTGSHVFNIVATTDDGQREQSTVAADDEWKARTRHMAISRMTLRGQHVEYAVETVA